MPADEAHVQRGLAAVGGDQQHVVFLGRDGTGADLLGAIAEPGNVGAQLGGGRDQHRFGCPPPVGPRGELWARELEIFCGARVGEHCPHAEHLGDVLKPAEAGVHPVVPAAGRGHLDLRDGLPECCGPAVEVLDAGGGEEVGPQVAAHDVRLGDAVGDRGGGREGDGPRAVAVAQPADLHVQIAGALGPVDRGVANIRRGVEVLVVVGLVDAQVVDPGLLERDAWVLGAVEALLEALLGGERELLQPFDGQPVAAASGREHRSQPVDLPLGVGGLDGGGDGDPLKRRAGHHDRVPIVRGGAGDERAALLAGEVLRGGGQ